MNIYIFLISNIINQLHTPIPYSILPILLLDTLLKQYHNNHNKNANFQKCIL
ncbi:hypothetical protein Hanom_Chr07g00659231 [Helianthus anomalus]